MPAPPLRLGFCMTGSFCTFQRAFEQMERCVAAGYEVLPVFSFNASTLDTRFGKAADHLARARLISGHEPILTIQDAIRAQRDKLSIDKVMQTQVPTTSPDALVADIMPIAAEAVYPLAVVGEDGQLKGIVTKASVLASLI